MFFEQQKESKVLIPTRRYFTEEEILPAMDHRWIGNSKYMASRNYKEKGIIGSSTVLTSHLNAL